MSGRIRLGAVEYLNARPLVWKLDASPRFAVRYDVPARCAELLHANEIDLGLIPSIEYLRGPLPYWIVPEEAVTSRGPVASVALYTRREPEDIRSIALDLTSRTSVALTRIVATRIFRCTPELTSMAPDLPAMLERADAALVIGDKALMLEDGACGARKIDLGALWTEATGLPFVYAFWAGRRDVASAADVRALNDARDLALAEIPAVAEAYYPADARLQRIADRYLRDNIRYSLGADERAGLETFYRYAAELGLVSFDGRLRFYHAERD